MHKLEFIERSNLTQLFHAPSSAIILSSLYNNIGETWINDNSTNQTGILFVGNTFFIGGQSMDKDCANFLMGQINKKKLSQCYIIPQTPEQFTYCEEYFLQPPDNYSIVKSERHLMEIDMNHINHDRLVNYINEIPSNYQLSPINEDLFHLAKNGDRYLLNFVQLFEKYSDFEKDGLGFFLMDGNDIIAGISSYARYSLGVEVQIAVKPEYRGQHLARSLGAKFILECEKKELYPWWDCANPISEHVAIQLGYVLKQVTPIFICTLRS